MLQIKFSHDYLKFPRKLPFVATLLQCFLVDYKDLSSQFEYHDCIFTDKKGVADMYKLPKGKLIVLLLYDLWKDAIFTTIRRYTSGKWEYYKKHEGCDFEIVKV